MTELTAWLRLYRARTSDGNKETLKFTIGLDGVIGVGPVAGGAAAVAAGAVATAGAGAAGLNAVKAVQSVHTGVW